MQVKMRSEFSTQKSETIKAGGQVILKVMRVFKERKAEQGHMTLLLAYHHKCNILDASVYCCTTHGSFF